MGLQWALMSFDPPWALNNEPHSSCPMVPTVFTAKSLRLSGAQRASLLTTVRGFRQSPNPLPATEFNRVLVQLFGGHKDSRRLTLYV
jgi:hypothetical protein